MKSVLRGPIKQYSSIGSDKDLAPNRGQAIIWTKGDLVLWGIYASSGLNEFIKHNYNIIFKTAL